MRMSTKFLEFLKFTFADEISYSSAGFGEFRVSQRTDMNYWYQEDGHYEEILKISEKLRLQKKEFLYQ